MASEYAARNPGAMRQLIEQHGVSVRSYPADVIAQLRKVSEEVVAEVASKDDFSKKVYVSYKKFLDESRSFSSVSDLAYLKARDET
jgi:TRAP-type mannitol/chloroaromatic compound transport system substrate-binding protein